MTDLLDPPGTSRRSDAASRPVAPKPLGIGALVAGVGASAAVLLGCMVAGLVGWFASDAGSHGNTRDALRVGADGWLLALGAHLQLGAGSGATTITAVPLGLTLLCLVVAYRLGAWAGATSAVEDTRTLALGAVVMSGVYGVVAVLTAVLAAIPSAEPSLLRSFVGGFLVALVGGGAGLFAGSRGVLQRPVLPEVVVAVARGALAAVLLLLAAAALLVTVSLVMHLGTAANVLARLHTDVAGGLLYTLLVAAVAPNAVLLGGAYLLGPGFAVGAGTLVSPSAVVLGPVPAFPLLAALPSTGPAPAWAAGLVAVPVLSAIVGAVLMVRRHPAYGYDTGAARGLGAGALAGVLLTVAVALSGGAVGPGRMAHVGADLVQTFFAATVAMGIGGLVGGLLATWWARRRSAVAAR
jgi:Family of unknown function (DUF6350)